MFRNREQAIRVQKLHGSGAIDFFAPGAAPAMVALHGFSGTASELLPTLRAVATAGFAVDGALLPGHGTTIEDLQATTYDDWLAAARARAETAAREHGRVVLLGFSMGSLLALEIASAQPAWLAGVALLGNALTLLPPSRVPLGLWDRAGWTMPDAYFYKPFGGNLVDPTLMETLVTYDHHPLRAALEVYRGGPRVRALVGRVRAPLLILHGRRDHVCPWSNAPWLAEHAGSTDVTVRIFEKSAHVLACDAERDEVAREVVDFVRRAGASPHP